MEDARDLKNKSIVNFREEPFQIRTIHLGKKEAESKQQSASSEYPAQLFRGMTCLWLTKIFGYLNKNVSLSRACLRMKPTNILLLLFLGTVIN